MWIVRIERELSDQELQSLERWLAESPKHREAFVEAARLWDRMDVLSKLSNLFPLENFKPAPSRVPWKSLSALAAALAFLAIFQLRPEAGFFRLPTRVPTVTGRPETMPAAQTYRTVIGKQSLVSLSDGTRIRLNTDSLIEVSYSPNSRRVHMVRGEALFEVAKDASRPPAWKLP
jgi:transmembrane sensor